MSENANMRGDGERRRRRSPANSNGAGRKKQNTHYVLQDELETPPHRRTRPREEGETIGDALFFGDDLMFGVGGEQSSSWPELLRERLVKQAGFRLVRSALPGRTTQWNDERLAEKSGEWAKAEDFNGLFHFGTLFSSHTPLWLIIQLGTNDLKAHIREESLRAMREDAQFTFRQDISPRKSNEEEGANEEGVDRNQTMDAALSSFLDTTERAPIKFTADIVAKSAGSLALKARRLFEGHCHEGNLHILVITPPTVLVSPQALKAGFDSESCTLSRQLPKAFEQMSQQWNIPILTTNHSWSNEGNPSSKEALEMAEAVWGHIVESLPRGLKRLF